ncbi:unnamed protein product, partial [Scytosiphon promiscuus]
HHGEQRLLTLTRTDAHLGRGGIIDACRRVLTDGVIMASGGRVDGKVRSEGWSRRQSVYS